jgi:hypothetical protein
MNRSRFLNFPSRVSFVLRISIFGFLIGAASAQVLKPIDQRKLADPNGKTVEMPTVRFDTVPQPTRPQPVSPLSRQYRPRAGTVETRTVDTHGLSYSTIPVTVLPQQNFAPKRATVPGNLPAAETVKTSRAEINQRVIRPFTPAGKEELKEQFKNPK